MKIFLTLFFSTIFILLANGPAQAYVVPSFPSCANPSGEIKVEYASGQHAIVGQEALREGSDKVYAIFDGNILQCFCPDNGQGVQTNWWKISGLSQNEINSLKNQGWHYIPSGRDWGLESDPYLAKNQDYNCKPNGGGGNSGSDSSSSNNTSNGIGGGEVLSSFAPTGGKWMTYLILIFGVSIVLAAFAFRKK